MPRYPCPKTGKKDIYPSVTEIISDCTNSSGALTQWAANMVVEWIKENVDSDYNDICDEFYPITPSQLNDARFHFREVSQKALDVGSAVHGMIEDYFKGKTFSWLKDETTELAKAFNAFLKWEKENNLKSLYTERKVYGDRWAGTLDFYGHFNDVFYVIDWKSSKAHYPEMRYQIAAYRYALRKEHRKVGGSGILRLDKKTGLPDFKDHSKTYKQDLAVFNAMVDLYYLRHPRIAKKFKEAQDEIS